MNKKSRHEDRAEEVDVAQWIKGQAVLLLGRRVPKVVGHVPVTHFVQRRPTVSSR